jgi:type II secretory pathway component GspD/PulD (secretin)
LMRLDEQEARRGQIGGASTQATGGKAAAAETAEATREIEQPRVRIFRLRASSAVAMARVLEGALPPIAGGTPLRAVADERTNSVVVSGGDEQLGWAEELLMQLDKEQEARAEEERRRGSGVTNEK